jgi:Family of unknown function (DUF6527)
MIYRYLAVGRIPDHLDAGVVYHNENFELAALLCACGCGHRVILLVPDSHQISSESGLATIRPSIAVCDAHCKSHFYITAGEVEWLPAFSGAQAHLVMRNQIARHASLDKRQISWVDRVQRAMFQMASAIGAFFRGKRP